MLSVDAVTSAKARAYRFQNTEFRFFRVKEELYFGFSKERADGKSVSIAEKEKIILDYLSLRRNAATVSLVSEKLRALTLLSMRRNCQKKGSLIRLRGWGLSR